MLYPDYGLYVMKKGLTTNSNPNETKHYFYDVYFYGMNMLSLSDFTICLNNQFDGQTFAISFDFDQTILENILGQLPKWHAQSILEDINNAIKVKQSAVNFTDSFIAAAVECHIGMLQTSLHEQFVPFVIDSIKIK